MDSEITPSKIVAYKPELRTWTRLIAEEPKVSLNW
jgi:hypothetical protein